MVRLSEAVNTNIDFGESEAKKPRGRLGDVLSTHSVQDNNVRGMDLSSIVGVPKSLKQRWEKQPKIGFMESARRSEAWNLVPFIGGALSATKAFQIKGSVDRLKENNYGDNTQRRNKDISVVRNFLLEEEEKRIRGYTIGGQIARGVNELPAFMVEFMATGGIASIGKKAVKESAEKILGEAVERGALGVTTRVVATTSGAAVRTVAMPQRVASGLAERRLNAQLELTRNGLQIAQESTEKPHVSFVKSFGDVWIENVSEVTGPAIGSIGKKVSSRVLPKAYVNGMVKLFKKLKPNEKVANLFTKSGYNGFLEELGEERVGSFLRALVGVEDFGAEHPEQVFDRLLSSWPSGEELMVEAGVLSFPGGVRLGTSQAIDLIKKRKLKSKEAEEVELNEITDDQVDDILEPKEEKDVGESDIGEVESQEVFQKDVKENLSTKKQVITEKISNIKTKKEAKSFIDSSLKEEIDKISSREKERLEEKPRQEAELNVLKDLIKKTKDLKENEISSESKRISLEELTNRKDEIQLRLKKLSPKKVTRKETTVLRDKIKNIKRGFRRGRKFGVDELKEAQSEIINFLDSIQLDRSQKGKLIKSIKNININKVNEDISNIQERAVNLLNQTNKNNINQSIKKELKKTKPVKSGQKSVGRFDLETNRFFKEIRSLYEVTKSDAKSMLDSLPEEISDESDLIKRRVLELKANGKSSSVEMYEQVLSDIKRMKEIGRKAKNQEEFIKILERTERIDGARASIGKVKANKKKIKTKIGNVYRKGFSNIYSMLNSIGGKAFAEKYDPELSEEARNTAIFKNVNKVSDSVKEIYDSKNIIDVIHGLIQNKYTLIDNQGLSFEITGLELIDIYNSIKNKSIRKRYYDAFGKEQIDAILLNMTPQDFQFGDILKEEVQSYREVYAQHHIKRTGRDLGIVENYWPATSELEVDVFDDIRFQSETPSAEKKRAKGKVIPVPSNTWYKYQKHISQGEHVRHLSGRFEEMKELFSDRRVKNDIVNKFGEDIHRTLLGQIDNISLNRQTEKIDSITGAFKVVVNNWVTAKIALNPSTFIKQLASIGNYIENMPSTIWVKEFSKGILKPKKTFDFMWKNAPFLETRFNRGYSEALEDAIRESSALGKNWKSWVKILTSFTRVGDMTGIIFGGAPYVRYLESQGMNRKEAFKEFEKATLKSQQSGLSSSISQFQNSSNPFTRLFLAFKNTANQYFRKQVDAMISYANGDISKTKMAKTLAIYGIIQPTLYASSWSIVKQIIGNISGTGEDEEEFKENLMLDIMSQIAISPVIAVPIIDDIANAATRKLTGRRVYKIFNTALFDDVEDAMRKVIMKKEPTGSDYFEASASVLEVGTAAPVETYIRLFKLVFGERRTL